MHGLLKLGKVFDKFVYWHVILPYFFKRHICSFKIFHPNVEQITNKNFDKIMLLVLELVFLLWLAVISIRLLGLINQLKGANLILRKNQQ